MNMMSKSMFVPPTPEQESASRQRCALEYLIQFLESGGTPASLTRLFSFKELASIFKNAREKGESRDLLLKCLEEEGDTLLDLITPFLEEYVLLCESSRSMQAVELRPEELRAETVRLLRTLCEEMGEECFPSPDHPRGRPGQSMIFIDFEPKYKFVLLQ